MLAATWPRSSHLGAVWASGLLVLFQPMTHERRAALEFWALAVAALAGFVTLVVTVDSWLEPLADAVF